jgi:hypothetical protein
MIDLFDWTPSPRYPTAPGFKERTTSRDAARKAEASAPGLRGDVLRVLRDVWPAGLTPDEAAALLGKPALAVRPRFSELKATGQILATSIKRRNESGLLARVYVARRPT